MRTGTFILLLSSLLSSSTLAHADPASASPSDAQAGAALQLYDRGLAHVRAKEFAAAAAAFEAAFQTDPRPAVLYNLGLALAADERPVEAVRTLTQYLDSAAGSVSPARRKLVDEVLEAQRQRIGTLTINAPPGTVVSIDERELGQTPLDGPIQLSAGMHTVSARRVGFVSTTQSLRIEPLAAATLELTLEGEPPRALTSGVQVAAPEHSPPSHAPSAALLAPTHRSALHAKQSPNPTLRALGLGSAAGAIVFASLGTIFALKSHSAEQRVMEASAPGTRWDSSYEAAEASGRSAQYAAWGCFGAAGLFAGVAGWLLIWPPRSKTTSNDVTIEASPRGVTFKGAVRF
jgi:hypothetical protein